MQWLVPTEAALTVGVLPVEVCLEYTAAKLHLLAESSLKATESEKVLFSAAKKFSGSQVIKKKEEIN